MDDVDHADKERRGIIERYDRGREEGAKIDDWEDPDLPLYHTTDRYGFIHDETLPKLKSEEQRRIQLETDRVDKWVKMRSKWDKFRGSEKLRQRVYKGIPDKVRGPFWALLMELETLKVLQKGKYQEMLKIGREYSPDVRQIDLDVNRTYRDHINFRERFSTSQKSLFNILCAYSVYNVEVGYCQGMSQIAALLLMYLAEEDAFWALAQLMTHHKYAMHGFFVHGFPKLARFQAHHDKILTKMLPKLKKHFDKHGIDSGLYTLKWFFQCFLDRVPFELCLRFWDIYFLEGERILTRGAYTILRIHAKHLLARKNMDDILGFIQSRIPEKFGDTGMDFDRVIEKYQEYTEDLQGKRLDDPGPPGDNESATKPFGSFQIPIPKPSVSPVPITPITPTPSSISPSPSPIPISAEEETQKEPEPTVVPPRVSSSSPTRDTDLNHSTTTSLRPSASSVGHHLLNDSRRVVSPTRIKVPPPVTPRNPVSISPNHSITTNRSVSVSPRNHSPANPSSPPVSPHRIGNNSPSSTPSPPPPPRVGTVTNSSTGTSTPGVITLRIHVPYAGTS